MLSINNINYNNLNDRYLLIYRIYDFSYFVLFKTHEHLRFVIHEFISSLDYLYLYLSIYKRNKIELIINKF